MGDTKMDGLSRFDIPASVGSGDAETGTPYDVYLVGVGGQGIVTVGDLMAEAAMELGLAVNVYPTKGMAQRGGSVTVQVRLGRSVIGPEIPERTADLVIAMERSEALKGLRYARSGADFILYGQVWEPTKVMLGRAAYPTLDEVREKARGAGVHLRYLNPGDRPRRDGAPVPANVYVLGAALGSTGLGRRLDADTVSKVIAGRWKRHAAVNEAALRAGLETLADGR